MSLLSPLLELSISSRMYRHSSRFDSLGWHFTVKVPLQQIILAQCVFLWDQSCSLMIQVRYFSGLSIVNLIFLLYCASNDICFLQYCVHVTVLSALRHGKLFLSSLTVLRRKTWRRGLWNSPYLSPGDSRMDFRAFIMLLLWSEEEYGLLTSNLLRLGLRGFSNNGLTFNFNCLFTSNILWVENDTWKKIIKVGFTLHVCRLLLAKRHVSQYSRIRNFLPSPDHKEEL